MEHLVKLPSQRMAWLVLLVSFGLCCGLTVGVPLTAASFVNSATYQAAIMVKLQAGRTNVFAPPVTEADARVVGQEGRVIEEGATPYPDPQVVYTNGETYALGICFIVKVPVAVAAGAGYDVQRLKALVDYYRLPGRNNYSVTTY